MNGWDGEGSTFSIHGLAHPLVWWAGGLLLFAALVRWRILQRLRGATLLAAFFFGLFALAASQEALRTALLVPARLEVLLFLGVNVFVFWLALHERLAPEGEPDSRPAGAFSAFEIWLGAAAALSVLVAALVWGVPSDRAAGADFFHGETGWSAFLAPWVADILVPGLVLATLFALPWLHRPAAAGPAVDPVPRNAGLILCGLGWLLLVLVPMAAVVFGGPAPPPERTLAQLFWFDALETEMPASWILRESPGMGFLLVYFVLVPFLLLRLKTSRGFCRRSLKALGKVRYAVLLGLVLVFALVSLEMVSRWWLGVGAWISIPELPFYF